MNLTLVSKHSLCTLLLLTIFACGGQSEQAVPPPAGEAATLTVSAFQVLAYDPDLAFAQWDALPSGGATLAMTSLDGEELSGFNYIRLTSGHYEIGYRYDVTLSCDANGNCETRTGYGALKATFASDGWYTLRLVCNTGALLAVITTDQDGKPEPTAEGEALEDYGICDDLTSEVG